MESRPPVVPGLGAYLAPGPSSFTDFVTANAPHLLPATFSGGSAAERGPRAASAPVGPDVPHGTTIVALVFAEGVVIAGDRRATSGNVIAQRDIEKVFVTDEYSAVGIAGAAGIAIQMVRLFSVELEHYEKMEGVALSLAGKANKLASMVAGNLGAALQGFVALPLFVGYDTDAEPAKAGRIVTYDATGGRYDEWLGYHSIGSGSMFAKSALKKRHSVDADLPTAIRTAVESLYDAADDDSATGGPDLTRRIYPIVVSITAEGAVKRPEAEIEAVVREVVAGRTENPGMTAMTMPFYSSVDQLLRDRSELARKGISRGRSVVVLTYTGGVLFVAENGSTALHKVSEIYDRIGFAAVGRYNEFETLRNAGIRMADVRGYSYDRRDVTGRMLANFYAQVLGTTFVEQQKPYEVELCLAGVGEAAGADQLYRVTYDGSITHEMQFVVMGGTTDPISAKLKDTYRAGLDLGEAITIAVEGLQTPPTGAGGANGQAARVLGASALEVAVLDRARPGRTFRRLTGTALRSLLPEANRTADDPPSAEPAGGDDVPAGGGGEA